MKLSDKLDRLQELARMYAEDASRLYLIELLAEHAEEAEMDERVLGLVMKK